MTGPVADVLQRASLKADLLVSSVVQLVRDNQALKEEAETYKSKHQELSRELLVLRQHLKKDEWMWQGDGTDHLDSMAHAMVVVIRADQLRDLLRNSEEVDALSCPDDIRAKGWTVAVHNDYRLNKVAHTFWLFTKGSVAIKGEGKTDREALDQVRKQIEELE